MGFLFCRGLNLQPQFQVFREPTNGCRFRLKRTATHTSAGRVAHRCGRACIAPVESIVICDCSACLFFSYGRDRRPVTEPSMVLALLRTVSTWPPDGANCCRVASTGYLIDRCPSEEDMETGKDAEIAAKSRTRQPFADRETGRSSNVTTRSNFQQFGKAPCLVGEQLLRSYWCAFLFRVFVQQRHMSQWACDKELDEKPPASTGTVQAKGCSCGMPNVHMSTAHECGAAVHPMQRREQDCTRRADVSCGLSNQRSGDALLCPSVEGGPRTRRHSWHC